MPKDAKHILVSLQTCATYGRNPCCRVSMVIAHTGEESHRRYAFKNFISAYFLKFLNFNNYFFHFFIYLPGIASRKWHVIICSVFKFVKYAYSFASLNAGWNLCKFWLLQRPPAGNVSRYENLLDIDMAWRAGGPWGSPELAAKTLNTQPANLSSLYWKVCLGGNGFTVADLNLRDTLVLELGKNIMFGACRASWDIYMLTSVHIYVRRIHAYIWTWSC